MCRRCARQPPPPPSFLLQPVRASRSGRACWKLKESTVCLSPPTPSLATPPTPPPRPPQALAFAEGNPYHALKSNCICFADFVVRVLTGGAVKCAPLIYDLLVGQVRGTQRCRCSSSSTHPGAACLRRCVWATPRAACVLCCSTRMPPVQARTPDFFF